MKLFFDWCQSYNEEKNFWRGDEEIISLEISQRECGFASAKISIFEKSTQILMNKKYAKIGVIMNEKDGENAKLLFTGRLVSFPVGFDGSCLQLEFISEPNDYQEQLAEFSRKKIEDYANLDKHLLLETDPEFDDLFFSSCDISNNPTVFLEGNTKLFYWNMRDGKLSLSDINRGKNNIKIGGSQILQNSLRVHLAREPYKSVNISVSANWVQRSYGYIDLYPLIAKNFRNGVINSYTNIKRGMENLCKFSYKSGYRLLEYNIKEVIPTAQSQYLRDLPTVSKTFGIDYKPNSKRVEVKFRRFYFDGTMLIEWHHKQKRVETANINVVNTKTTNGRRKNINLKLNSIQLPKSYPLWTMFTYFRANEKVLHNGFIYECKEDHMVCDQFDESKWRKLEKIPDALQNDSQHSFFTTDRGKNAIRYAIQKAIALINYSSRYVEISFSVNAKDYLFATINDEVTIIDSRFLNGSITGKIIKTKFLGDSNSKIMCISIACCQHPYDITNPSTNNLPKILLQMLK